MGEEGGRGVVGGGGSGGVAEGEREAFAGVGFVESGRKRELGESVQVGG